MDTMMETIDSQWREAPGSMQSRVSAVAKRVSGAVSHHNACQTSAREQHEKGEPCRSYFYECSSSRSKSQRAPLSLLVLLVTWTSLLSAALAQAPSDQRGSTETPSLLVLGRRAPPVLPLMHLYRRQDEEKATTITSGTGSKSSLETDSETESPDFEIPRPFEIGRAHI